MITDYNRELEILYRINKRDIKTLVNKKQEVSEQNEKNSNVI